MKHNTKSSITLPRGELELVLSLMKKLGAQTKVEVVRRGLLLLQEKSDRESLRAAFHEASQKTRKKLKMELEELEALTSEGLDKR